MNGVHDMGGMQDMKLVLPEPNEPVFHENWEGRMYALTFATFAWGKFSVDAYRTAIERIPPADYLRMSYYEKWLAALLILLEKERPRQPRRARERPPCGRRREGKSTTHRRQGSVDPRRRLLERAAGELIGAFRGWSIRPREKN